MAIHVSQSGNDATRILVRGMVTSDDDLRVLDELADRLCAVGTGAVLLDLSECSFVDTRVIGPILHLKRGLDKEGRDLQVVASNQEHISFFKAIELDKIVQIVVGQPVTG